MHPHETCDTGGDAGSHETALRHAAPHPARAVPQVARVDTGDPTQDAGPRWRRSADRAADDVARAGRTNRVDGAGRKRRAASRTRRDSSCPPGRPRLGGLAACSLATAFLAVCAVDLALFATPAQAQTTVWSATLDPIVTFSGDPVPLGCDNTSGATWQCSNSDRLSDDDFTDDGMTYAVTKFFTKDGVLTFRLDTGATAATQGLTLVIDSEEFVLKEADRINGGKTQWKWNNTTLSWTAGTDVAVSLVVTDAPATGQPTISGAAQVSKTLTAATDDIEDLDGLPTTPTFTYQWVRVDGLTDTDIPGATSETYTLTASDLGKQIKVKVSFTDSRGHAEGPLTSGAYPPNNGTVVAAVGPCPAVNDWCATMTAAVDRDAVGYEYDKFGSLTDDQIEYGDEEFNVLTVHTQQEASRDYFYFGAEPRVPLGTVITVGERTFTTDMESDDGGVSDLWAYLPGELPPDLVWSDGQEVRVSLVLGSSPPTLSIADASAAENDGHLMFDVTLSPASPHTVKVDFETISGGTATEGVDYWAHDYTHVIPAGETTTKMGFALIEDTVTDAGETVMVRLSNARLINKRGKKKADLDITTAEATGTITAPSPTTTNVPGLTIRIRDATGDEDDGYLDFKVRLSRKYDKYVCYDFESISGGTATEGTDYLKFPKATYWVQIGKRVDTPFVRIIDDSVNDNGETVKVKISNAHVCGDASQTVSITRDEATGTIRNSDPLPAEEATLSVAGPLLTLGYPGPLDGGSTPSPRDFVVTAEAPGGAKDMVAVAAVSLHGPDVFLQLGRPVAPDETVVLTYLTAAMHPIHDAAGLPAAPLADEPVRNVTGASGPLAEAALAAGTAIPVPLAALLQAAQEGAGTERLDLSSRNLTDLSALAGLTGLRELDLSGNAITDLGPLAGLTGLEVLDLSGNQIEDLWPLTELTGLEVLDLSGNQIEELWPLAGLTGLEVLDLSGNQIEELWPLAGLTALERLSLADNRIADLWPLTGLSGLEVLLLDRNRVADVLALSQLAGLANLGLAGNRIADIGLLAELGGLRRLDLSGNAVADVSALGEMSGLVWLRLPGNPVSDVTPLGRLEKLLWLWLDSATAAGMESLAPPAGRGAAQLWIELAPAQ